MSAMVAKRHWVMLWLALEAQGYAVTREFYYNDAGVQIQNLALSVQGKAKHSSRENAGLPEAAYHGEYIQGYCCGFCRPENRARCRW